MSLDILKTRIKENNISGVYLFCGQEEYTKDHYAELIRKKIDSAPLPEFNHIFFNASKDKISDLEDAFFALPYMSEQKLIEITDISSAKLADSELNDYRRIFSDVPDYLTVLVILRADEYGDDQKSSSKSGLGGFVSVVKDNGLLVDFETEKADKLTPWIIRHFNAAKVLFEPSVPRELINYCGSDMYILQSEVTKLCLAFDGKPISVSDVHRYCCANSAYKYFDIASALNRRDMVMAKKILESLELGRDDIPMALGFLAKNYSEMLIVKTGLDSGKNPDAIARELKIPSWRIGKIASAVSGNDIKSIGYAVSQIAAADARIKSMRTDPARALEMTFYRICTYGRKA